MGGWLGADHKDLVRLTRKRPDLRQYWFRQRLKFAMHYSAISRYNGLQNAAAQAFQIK